MIPYGCQDITDEDIEAVSRVLRSDYLTQGPSVPRFEEAVQRIARCEHAVAVNSATSALHIGCMALDLGPGDTLWTVPNTFVATSNCALYCGASVDFVDIDANTWNLDVGALQKRLEEARASGTLPKVVAPVHFAGQPTDQEAIHALAQEYGFRIIEDASHAIGASRNGEPVGSCRWSDITVFSFHPVKIITSGEGGMALTNDPLLAQRLRMLRTHGVTRDATQFTHAPDAPADAGPATTCYYEQHLLGYNYRLTDIHAALGESQMSRLDAYVAKRNELAKRYDEKLASIDVQTPTVTPGNLSAFHLYIVRLKDASRHAATINAMRAAGIGVNLHYLPVHLQPYYRNLGFTEGQFPNAEAHARTAISLPMHPRLTEQDQDRVIRTLESLI